MHDRYAVASRAAVPPFHVMDVLAAAAERQRTHGDLLNLTAGQPTGCGKASAAQAAGLCALPLERIASRSDRSRKTAPSGG